MQLICVPHNTLPLSFCLANAAYGNLGVVLQASGRLAEAEWSFRKALSHRANMGDVHYNL